MAQKRRRPRPYGSGSVYQECKRWVGRSRERVRDENGKLRIVNGRYEILGETATMTKKKAAEIWMQKLVEAAAAKTQPDDDQKENENSGDQKAETDFGNITFEQHATSGRSIS